MSAWKRQRRGRAVAAVSSGPAAANVRETHEPVEVTNLRRIADIG